jgi:hypothetical protein
MAALYPAELRSPNDYGDQPAPLSDASGWIRTNDLRLTYEPTTFRGECHNENLPIMTRALAMVGAFVAGVYVSCAVRVWAEKRGWTFG